MTIKSARNFLDSLDYLPNGYCMPLAIDSTLPVSELPREYYQLGLEVFTDPNSSHNKFAAYILEHFFGVNPWPATETASLAKFHAFGASPQSYMPDVAYDYRGQNVALQQEGVSPKQLRLRSILVTARNNDCSVVFTNNDPRGEHVSALQMIDCGDNAVMAQYIIRDLVEIKNDRIYTTGDITGIRQVTSGAERDEFTPLPEVSRSYFPNHQSSWELTIFPPDPKK